MSTPRRPRPTPHSQPPGRRPKVAGLRKPGEGPSPRPRTEPEHALPDEPDEVDQFAEADAATEADAPAGYDEPEADFGEAAAATPVDDSRRSPRAKARDTGMLRPTSEDEVPVEKEPADYEPRPAANAYNLTGALAATALVLALVAAFFAYKWLTDSGSANAAHVDAAGTAEVKQQVTDAVEALFSYDHRDLSKTEKAADDLLAEGDVRTTYDCLLGEVKRLAPEQKMVATVRVSRVAPIEMDDEKATMLVFVEQSAVRDGKAEEGSYGGGQLTISTVRGEDGKWQVSEIDAYEDKKVAECKAKGGGN